MRKIGLMILLIGCFLLLFSSFASAAELKQVTIPDLGTFSIPADYIFIESQTKGPKAHALTANDKGIWRSNIIMVSVISNAGLAVFEGNPAALENVINSGAGAGGTVLEKGSFKSTNIGNKKVITGNLKILASGLAVNMNLYLYENNGGVVMTLFMTPDGDAAFWRAFNANIIAGVQ